MRRESAPRQRVHNRHHGADYWDSQPPAACPSRRTCVAQFDGRAVQELALLAEEVGPTIGLAESGKARRMI